MSDTVQCADCGERWRRVLMEAFPSVPGCPACEDWAALTAREQLAAHADEAEEDPPALTH